MNDPGRLKHDPAFRDETGCDLGTEQLVVGGYDLEGLRARVLQGGAPPIPPSTPWWKVFLASAGTAAAVSLAIAFLVQPGPTAAVPPSRSPSLDIVTTGVSTEAVRAVRFAPESAPMEPLHDAALPLEPPTTPIVDETPVAPVPAAPPRDGPAPDPEGSTLSAELAEYNRARDAAGDGRWNEAQLTFQAYLDRYPAGRLRTEARLGLLSSLVGSGQTAEAAEFAARLTADPTLAHRHADLTLVRAEALVELDRCDEALGLVDGLKRTPRSTAVKQTCRKQRR